MNISTQKNVEDFSNSSSDMLELNAPSKGQLASQTDVNEKLSFMTESSVYVGARDSSPGSSTPQDLASEVLSPRGSEVAEGPDLMRESIVRPRWDGEGEFEEEPMGEDFKEVEGEEHEESIEGEEVLEEEEDMHRADEYTYIDTFELSATGEEVSVRKLVPKIKEETFVKKKMVPITVKFNTIGDGDELIEEEETVEEEMNVRITRITVLVKEVNDQGEEVLLEKVIEKEEVVVDKPKKYKKVFVTKTLPSGEEVEEEIEVLEEQEKPQSRKASEETRKSSIETEPEAFEEVEEEGIWEYEDYTQEYIDEGGEIHYIPSVRRVWKKFEKEDPLTVLIEDEKTFKLEILEELRKVRGKLKLYRQKNKFLGKKLCQYYKLKRKNIRDERQRLAPEMEAELRRQYHRRLLEYNEVRQFLLNERETRNKVLKDARKVTENLKTELEARISSFFERQREIVKKLEPKISRIALRNVDFEHIVNQQVKMDQLLSEVRHNYVRKMNEFTELKRKHAMRKRTKPSQREDDVDIVTYEQLKVATRDLQDKLDIKESYILSLKEKLVHAVQTLAHVRFKNEAVDQSLENINKEIIDSKRELAELRNECVYIRGKRSKVTKEVKKTSGKFGIMKYPMLVKDYYEIVDEREHLAEELSRVKMTVEKQKALLEECKKNRKMKF